jgi:sulfonate transport system permease protein
MTTLSPSTHAIAAPGLSPPAGRGVATTLLPLARRAAVPVGLVALWQAGSSLGAIPAATLASPVHVASAGWELIRSGELADHLAVSLRRAAIGLVVGGLVGLVLGTVAGLSRRGEELVDATMQMLRTIPFLALVPLFILWFGIGEASKVAVVAFGSAFPMYLNTYAGIRGVDAKLVESARVLGLGRWAMVRRVVLPGALPSILVGLRYALGIAVIALVVAEQINATTGIGAMMSEAREFLRTDVIVVGLVVYSLLGLVADLAVRFLERRLLGWRQSFLAA